MRLQLTLAVLLSQLCLLKAQSADSINIVQDTVFIQGEYVDFRVKEKVHSPHKASFYAAILPGMGQVYNKKYWKLPILYGGIGACAYAINFNSDYYNRYRAAYRDFIIRDPGNKAYLEFIPNGLKEEDLVGSTGQWFEGALSSKKQYYRRYRDLSYMLMVGIYIIQIVDAAVDAHFYNFDVSDDLSLYVQPAALPPAPGDYMDVGGLGLQLKLKF